MATFARELQYEQSQQTEIMQEALRKALAKAETARAEADMELKRVQDSIKQETLKREKEYKARLAQVEANAWAEVASYRGSVRSVSAIASTGAAGRKLSFNRDVGKGEKTTKGLCKGIEVPGCHNGRLDNPAVTNEAKSYLRVFPVVLKWRRNPSQLFLLFRGMGGAILLAMLRVEAVRWLENAGAGKFI